MFFLQIVKPCHLFASCCTNSLLFRIIVHDDFSLQIVIQGMLLLFRKYVRTLFLFASCCPESVFVNCHFSGKLILQIFLPEHFSVKISYFFLRVITQSLFVCKVPNQITLSNYRKSFLHFYCTLFKLGFIIIKCLKFEEISEKLVTFSGPGLLFE